MKKIDRIFHVNEIKVGVSHVVYYVIVKYGSKTTNDLDNIIKKILTVKIESLLLQ